MNILEEENNINLSEENTTIRFGIFLFRKAIEEVKELEPIDDSLEKLLRLNLAVVHLMNSLELLLKAILHGKGRDIFNSKGETLNFFECLKGFTRQIMGINLKDTKDSLPASILSAKNLYNIRNEIVHIGNQISHYTIIPLFRDCLQFYEDQIEVYFPSFKQETKAILSETSEAFYISDDLPIYERYYRRYRHYLNSGDIEIASYSLFVALEAVIRIYYNKVFEVQRKYPETLLRIITELKKANLDVCINLKEIDKFRILRNKLVHGIEIENIDINEIIRTLNNNDIIYNKILDEIR